jgi:hypothetical protein
MNPWNEDIRNLYNSGVHVSEHSIPKLYMWAFIQKMKQGGDQNRIRKIRPSGIAGRLVETWAMVCHFGESV